MKQRTEACVLVLDDDPFMLKLLALMLAGLGCTRVTTCLSGNAALEWIGSHDAAPELILFDLNMPDMDGVEFVRHLVDRRFGGSLVLVSGENERMLQTAEALVRACRMTVLGHLHKPVTRQALAALLDRWAPQTAGAPVMAKRVYRADEVRAAIAGGELVNHYQPKVAVATGQVKGVEALVRWAHPVEGLLFPEQFVGVAEEHGLMADLTDGLLRAALSQARAWRDTGPALRVAINVSIDNLACVEFPELVAREAKAAGVPPEEVILEVMASRLVKDLRIPLEVLARLRLKRFSLSLDDFGTSHSSLAQLRNFRFDELKVDRGFVHGAHQDGNLRAIYNASLGLATQLGMDIVAQGVEDRSDWDFLRATGCGMAQGNFIGKPMPASAWPGWMQGWNLRVRQDLQAIA